MGSYAQSKKILIDSSKHLIIATPHPSPLSAHRVFLDQNLSLRQMIILGKPKTKK